MFQLFKFGFVLVATITMVVNSALSQDLDLSGYLICKASQRSLMVDSNLKVEPWDQVFVIEFDEERNIEDVYYPVAVLSSNMDSIKNFGGEVVPVKKTLSRYSFLGYYDSKPLVELYTIDFARMQLIVTTHRYVSGFFPRAFTIMASCENQ